MWIRRKAKEALFIKEFNELKGAVLIVRGARQVGKSSFIIDALGRIDVTSIKINLLYPSSFNLDGIKYLGRDFFGRDESGQELLKNIDLHVGGINKLEKTIAVFIDEIDRYPQALESIQTLAEFSDKLKFIITGSNLENLPVKNAATGRKRYFDLYPITFYEFLEASGDDGIVNYLNGISLANPSVSSEFFHSKINSLFLDYLRIGGMPKIVDAYLEGRKDEIPSIATDLAVSIEENVKTVLGEKTKLYEYEDVLRKIALFSMGTLKFSKLQVQHAGQSEAKKIVAKTVGARVAHKVRLFDGESDLSKYILFDCGIANYLLSGSDLLGLTMSDKNRGILYETFVGTQLIANQVSRDDLFYWKSGNRAEVEFILRSPALMGIDVKAGSGNLKSLNSFAIYEPDAKFIVKICDGPLHITPDHRATLPNYDMEREITLISIPHYLTNRLVDMVRELDVKTKSSIPQS